MSLNLPESVLTQMQGQFGVAVKLSEEAWEDTKADEDSVTGALIANIRNQVKGIARVGNLQYQWSTTLKKFGGRGPGAAEKKIGADAIFEVTVDAGDGRGKQQKILLMQAKKEWRGTDSALAKQCRDMEASAPKIGVAVDYGPTGYSGAAASDIVSAGGNRTEMPSDAIKPLADILGKEFLECRLGVVGAYYDAVRKLVVVPTHTTTARVRGHRVRIRITTRRLHP